MLIFVARRLAAAIPILFGVSLVGFLLMKLLPGDPTFFLLGPWATAEVRADLLTRLGWDRPVPVQYWLWLSSVMQGDFGQSTTYGVPVARILSERVANSAILTGFSFAIATFFGFGGGILTAVRSYSAIDRIVTSGIILLASVPTYLIGLLAVYLISIRMDLLPATGMYGIDSRGDIVDLVRHAILPALTAALVPMSFIFRLTRSTMMEVLTQPYIQAARARGISENRIILKHAIRNILAPMINVTGLQLGFLFGGSLFSEVIFAWPGIGSLVYESLGARDIPVIQTVVLFTGLLFVLINLVTDISQALIDPRTRS